MARLRPQRVGPPAAQRSQPRRSAYVLLDPRNPFFADVARGAEDAARQAGLAMFLCDSEEDAGAGGRVSRHPAGAAGPGRPHHAGGPGRRAAADAARARRAGRPRGSGGQRRAGWCSVSVDDVEGGDLAVTHLIELGHTRIGFVGGPHSPRPRSPTGTEARCGRWDRAASRRAARRRSSTAALTVAEGRRVGQRIAGLPPDERPSAVFCANDLLAIGVLQEMTRQGVAVPDDMAIVGYDDIDFAAAAAVPLTSVSQPRDELGRRACELLLAEAEALAAGPTATRLHVHQQIQFAPELVVRASSGAAPGRRRRPTRQRPPLPPAAPS